MTTFLGKRWRIQAISIRYISRAKVSKQGVLNMSNFIKFIVTVSSLAIVLSSCGGAEERKAAYLEKAKLSIEAGDIDKARIELKNVLQIDPKDGGAYYQLGKIYEQQKDYSKAFANYTKAAKLTPNNFENQAKLGKLYLFLARDIDKAKEKMDFILDQSPDDKNGLLLRAAILVIDKKVDEAITVSEKLFAKDKTFIDNSLFLATLYLKKENVEAALDTLEKTLLLKPDNENVTTALGKLLILTKDYDRAEVIYKDKLSRHPDVFSSYNNLASFYNIKGDQEKAIQVLRDGVENDATNVDRQITLAKYIRSVHGDAAAVKELESLIAADDSLGKLRMALGGLLFAGGDINAAKEVFKKAIADFPEDATGVEARTALAAIYLNEADTVKAKTILEEAIAVSPNDSKVNMLVAKLALKDEEYDNAIIALRIVIKESPENLDAYFLLSATYTKQDKKEQAKSIINTAYENNRANPEVLLKLSKYYASIQDLEKSEKIIDDFLSINGSNYEALSIKVVYLNKAKKFDEAKKVAKYLIAKFPNKSNGYVQSVQYLANDKKTDEAISLLEEGYGKVDNNRLILKMLTSLQVSLGQVDVAEARLKNEIQSAPDDVELHVLLAKLYFVKKDMDKAESKFKEIIQMQADNAEAYLLLTNIYSQAGNKAAVLSTLQDGHKNVKGNIKLSLGLARLYEGDKNYSDAVSVYEDIVTYAPNNVVAIN
ncbi:MAG: tetratricopeptide repeat protein, partial [Woeseiaceae bacterium]